MNCEQARGRMVDRWMKGIDEAERIEWEAHLAVCPACKSEMESLDPLWMVMAETPVEEPGRNLRARFHHMLEAYRLGAGQRTQPAPRSWFSWMPGLWPRQAVAQAALAGLALVMGLTAGHLWTARSHDRETISQLNGELKQVRHMVTLSLLQQQSASDRLRGVSWSMRNSADDEVLEALVDTLNADQNVNVRLAAVDALRQFSSQVTVRRRLRESLARQTSPLVQIALIDWAVDSKDRGAVTEMEQLGRQPELNPEVRSRLAAAIDGLREGRMQ